MKRLRLYHPTLSTHWIVWRLVFCCSYENILRLYTFVPYKILAVAVSELFISSFSFTIYGHFSHPFKDNSFLLKSWKEMNTAALYSLYRYRNRMCVILLLMLYQWSPLLFILVFFYFFCVIVLSLSLNPFGFFSVYNNVNLN